MMFDRRQIYVGATLLGIFELAVIVVHAMHTMAR